MRISDWSSDVCSSDPPVGVAVAARGGWQLGADQQVDGFGVHGAFRWQSTIRTSWLAGCDRTAGQAGLQRLHDPPPLALAAPVVPLRDRLAANASAPP